MFKNVKIRVYPDDLQKEKIALNLDATRFVYNHVLAYVKNESLKNNYISYEKMISLLEELIENSNYSFLKDADEKALTQCISDLYSVIKNRTSENMPKFKSKLNCTQSYKIRNQNKSIYIKNIYVFIPNIGKVRMCKKYEGLNYICSAIVTRTNTEKYFVTLLVKFEPKKLEKTDKVIGIDVGLKDFYVDSNGNKIENPRYYEKTLRRLKRQQKKLARIIENNTASIDENGKRTYKKPLNECSNFQKQKIRVAKLHERVLNQRDDFLHKQSRTLINNNDLICIEDLKTKNLIQEKKYSRSISSVAWYRFYKFLEYKALWYGKNVIKVPETYPSSQTCSNCGYINRRLKDLSIRNWTCPCCGLEHDRDINAAINILNKGLSVYGDRVTTYTA